MHRLDEILDNMPEMPIEEVLERCNIYCNGVVVSSLVPDDTYKNSVMLKTEVITSSGKIRYVTHARCNNNLNSLKYDIVREAWRYCDGDGLYNALVSLSGKIMENL